MTIEMLTTCLGWCSAINIALLLCWWLTLMLFHDHIFILHRRMFDIPEATMNTIHYCGLGLYKLAVLTFFVVPYLVLRFIV